MVVGSLALASVLLGRSLGSALANAAAPLVGACAAGLDVDELGLRVIKSCVAVGHRHLSREIDSSGG